MGKVRQGKRDQGKESKWVERMKEWEASGFGPREFCRRQGYKEVRFHWWRRVLQERGKWEPGDISGNKPNVLKTSTPPAFTQIQICPPQRKPEETRQEQNSTDRMMQVEVGDRYRVRVPSGFDPSTLDRILTVLEGRPC